MKNKRRMLTLALVMSVLMLFSGCVQIRITITNMDNTDTEGNTGEAEEAAGVTNVEEDSEALKTEALAAAESIFTQIKAYAGNDYEAFSALFCDTSEEIIQNAYAADLKVNQRDKTNYVYLGYAESLALVAVHDYIVSGTHPNTDLDGSNWNLMLKKQGEEWKLCVPDKFMTNDTDDYEALVIDSYLIDFLPEGCKSAYEAQRNYALGSTYDLSFDSTVVYEGCFHQEVVYLWQQEDGSVVIGVWLGNGTDVNISVDELDVTITDETLGTIVDTTSTESYPVVAGASTVVYLTVPADQVQTGTAAWGNWESYTHTLF